MSEEYSFANNFWGKDDAGVSVLLGRMHHAKQTCEEVQSFYKERASIEEEYSKKLLALSRRKLGSSETGCLKQALETIRASTESMGKAHAGCSQQIKSQLTDPLDAFAGSLRSRRKTAESTVEKFTKAKQVQNAAVEKSRNKFESDCNKINGYSAQQNLLLGKELERNNMKLDKVHMSVDNSRREYQASLRALAETIDHWNKEWKIACDKFQDLEEERINFLKSNLWAYTNIVSTVCVTDDEGCETIRVSLEKCDVLNDIQSFVKEHGTGTEILDPPEFINFLGGYSRDSVPEQYRVAKFSRDDSPHNLGPSEDMLNRSVQNSPLHGSTTSASSSVYTDSVSSASTTSDNDYYGMSNDLDSRMGRDMNTTVDSIHESAGQTTEKKRSWASPFRRRSKKGKSDASNANTNANARPSSRNQTYFGVEQQEDYDEYDVKTVKAKTSPYAQRFNGNTVQESYEPQQQQQKYSRSEAVLSMGDNMFDLDNRPSSRLQQSSARDNSYASGRASPKRSSKNDPLISALEKLKMSPGKNSSSSSLVPPQPAHTAEDMTATSDRYTSRTNEMFGSPQRRPQQQQRMTRPKSTIELRHENFYGDEPGYQHHSSVDMYNYDNNHDPYHRSKSASPGKNAHATIAGNPYGRSHSPNPYDRTAPPPMQQQQQQRATSPHPYASSPRGSPSQQQLHQYQQQHMPPQQMRPRSKSNVDLSAAPMGRASPQARPVSRGGNRLPPTSSDGRRVLRYSRAAYDYRAAIPEEVSFRKGDIMLVVRMQEDGWWEVEVYGSGRVGLAPSNFLVNLAH